MELVRELAEARRQRLRDLQPRIARTWPFPMLRVAACVLLRDLSIGMVLEDMYRGVPVIYVDLVGYDEVAHHSGPARPEALHALSEVDRQIGILERPAASAPRPYHLVVHRITCRRLGVEEVSTYREQVRVKPLSLPGSLEVDVAQTVPGASYHRTTATLNLTPERVIGAELPGWAERSLLEAVGGASTGGLLASPA